MPLLGRLRAARLVTRAARAARARRWSEAASLYEEALRLHPAQARILIQAGHMRKEAGDLAEAGRHYDTAERLRPDDADLALQLGHFHRVAGQMRQAADAYRRAAALRPDWSEPQRELERLSTVTLTREQAGEAALADDGRLLAPAPDILLESARNRLLPEYVPVPAVARRPGEGVTIRRLGRFERSPWGNARTLQGVEAILAHCVTSDPVTEVQVRLDGHTIRTEAPQVHEPGSGETGELRKYLVNLWMDFSSFVPGRHHLELVFRAEGNDREASASRSFRDYAVIVPPEGPPDLPGSETWVPPPDPNDPRSLDDQINGRPSVARVMPDRFMEPPRAILILRTDQLGDLAISVPALRRLRALAPEARIVGLFTSANADFARTLGLLDEVLVTDFPDRAEERQRVMSFAEQARLRDRLAPYRFDLAIDLAPADISRGVLLLSGARLTVGFGQHNFPWLGAAFDFHVRDARGRANILPSADKTLALVEAVGTLFAPTKYAPASANAALPSRFGDADGRLIVLHDGARVAFSRWPHYPALAARLLARDYRVVLLSDAPDARDGLPETTRNDPRFTLVDERLPFAELDALLSSCTLFIGNDSGPKHLAALRGTAVVSVHCARTNWGEWGQRGRGAIVTRQLPCAACHIYHEPEECGRGFVCVTAITVDEVMAAAEPFLARHDGHD